MQRRKFPYEQRGVKNPHSVQGSSSKSCKPENVNSTNKQTNKDSLLLLMLIEIRLDYHVHNVLKISPCYFRKVYEHEDISDTTATHLTLMCLAACENGNSHHELRVRERMIILSTLMRMRFETAPIV